MRTVWKFPISPAGNLACFDLALPSSAKPVLVASQMGKTNIWFEVETDTPTIRRVFQVVPTGAAIAHGAQHVQSFMTNNGAFVWHVYELQL